MLMSRAVSGFLTTDSQPKHILVFQLKQLRVNFEIREEMRRRNTLVTKLEIYKDAIISMFWLVPKEVWQYLSRKKVVLNLKML